MKNPLLRVTGLQHLPGFAWGFRSPALKLDVVIRGGDKSTLDKLAALSATLEAVIQAEKLDTGKFAPAPSVPPSATPSLKAAYPLDLVLYWTHRALLHANVPLFEKGRIIRCVKKHYCAAIPIFFMPYLTMKMILDALAHLINLASTSASLDADIASFVRLIKQIKETTQTGSNVPHFVKAAFELGIQTSYLAGNIIQYGQGGNARWMDSSFTDTTPSIGAGIARNKTITNSVLRQAGIPVAPQALVSSAQHAVAEAHKLGFPVVIKPADKDGGVAVHAGLMSEQQVHNAYTAARQHSTNIIIEKHVEGRDYRLNIFNNEILWAIERVPAGVSGDGLSTLRQLVEHENLNPLRSEEANSPLKTLVFDDEALEVLHSKGLHPDSIPAKDQFVALRHRANIGMGGMPVSVMGNIHPDNARLAQRAVTLLGLDLAGVDLLLPDIQQSWLKTGGIVCEVNGQPQLGAVTSRHTYGELLRKLFPTRGRIPIALVIGDHGVYPVIRQTAKLLEDAGIQAGWGDEGGIFIGAERTSPVEPDCYRTGKMLMLNREVEAVVLRVDKDTVLASGLPCDRFETLVIGGETVSEMDSGLEDILAMILPACTGQVLVITDGELSSSWHRAAAQYQSGQPPWQAVTTDQVAETLAQSLLNSRVT